MKAMRRVGNRVMLCGLLVLGASCGDDNGPPVPNRPPTATITAPGEGATFQEGASVVFNGSATDPEEGALAGSSLTWSSSLDGNLGVGEALTYSDLRPGSHRISLTARDNQNAAGTDDVNIQIQAVATEGSIRVTTVTSGSDIDPDGYTVAVGSDSESIPVNGSVTFSGLAEGSHDVTLSEIASNCRVLGDNPVSGNVVAGQTSTATFTVVCDPISADKGSINVTTTTTGGAPDPNGYQLSVTTPSSGDISGQIGVNDNELFANLDPGLHSVLLLDVAPNCTVTNGNPQATTVVAGQQSQVGFNISCQGVMAFESNRDGNREIYRMNVDGSGQVNLTNNPADDRLPAASPLGDKIAFQSNRDGDNEIFTVALDGSGVVQLTSHPSGDSQPAWSPDGARLAFRSDRDGNDEIYVMNADGSGLQRLTNDASADGGPAWSPDGTKIAFARDAGAGFDVYVMNADGSGVQRLTTDPSDDDGPAWSPDGTKIAFTSKRNGARDIYTMNPSGGGLARLTTDADDDGSADWSPDGSTIAFHSDRIGPSEFDIFTMNPDGSGQTRLTTQAGNDRAPSYGP